VPRGRGDLQWRWVTWTQRALVGLLAGPFLLRVPRNRYARATQRRDPLAVAARPQEEKVPPVATLHPNTRLSTVSQPQWWGGRHGDALQRTQQPPAPRGALRRERSGCVVRGRAHLPATINT